MTNKEDRMHILEMIDHGQISADEGLLLLKALAGEERTGMSNQKATSVLEPIPHVYLATEGEASQALQAGPPQDISKSDTAEALEERENESMGQSEVEERVGEHPVALSSEIGRRRHWWELVLWIGVGITVLGGLLMNRAFQASGTGFWFVCASLPLALGILVIVLAFQSRAWSWLHLRILQRPGKRPRQIAINLPAPIRLAAWSLQRFGHFIPGLDEPSLDEIVLALKEEISPEKPVFVQVNGDDGERVEVIIG